MQVKCLTAAIAVATLSLAARTWAVATAPSAPLPGAVGELTLGSGPTFQWTYHFDHNALIDSRLVGAGTIALTEAGNLLRYDLREHRITRERFGPVKATCLGQDPTGAVFAGYDDGRIERLIPRPWPRPR